MIVAYALALVPIVVGLVVMVVALRNIDVLRND